MLDPRFKGRVHGRMDEIPESYIADAKQPYFIVSFDITFVNRQASRSSLPKYCLFDGTLLNHFPFCILDKAVCSI